MNSQERSSDFQNRMSSMRHLCQMPGQLVLIGIPSPNRGHLPFTCLPAVLTKVWSPLPALKSIGRNFPVHPCEPGRPDGWVQGDEPDSGKEAFPLAHSPRSRQWIVTLNFPVIGLSRSIFLWKSFWWFLTCFPISSFHSFVRKSFRFTLFQSLGQNAFWAQVFADRLEALGSLPLLSSVGTVHDFLMASFPGSCVPEHASCCMPLRASRPSALSLLRTQSWAFDRKYWLGKNFIFPTNLR